VAVIKSVIILDDFSSRYMGIEGVDKYHKQSEF
jgi:hypothetical protein